MSAGTIWCMSADKIFMDYSSSLGPIDPAGDNKGCGGWISFSASTGSAGAGGKA